MIPYMIRKNSTVGTGVTYYDATSTTSEYDDVYYADEYISTSSGKETLFAIIPKEKQIFNRNKISNINIKLKQQILPVRQQIRFTTRNAL